MYTKTSGCYMHIKTTEHVTRELTYIQVCGVDIALLRGAWIEGDQDIIRCRKMIEGCVSGVEGVSAEWRVCQWRV